jgi:small subunit ribosomal protein S10e
MVQIQRSEKKAVYRYLLQEGVIVIHKDFTSQPHTGTKVSNIHVRTLLRSLYDRKLVELVFNWQYFYYFINAEGKKHLSEQLGLTEEVVPLTWKYAIIYVGRTRNVSISISSRIRDAR